MTKWKVLVTIASMASILLLDIVSSKCSQDQSKSLKRAIVCSNKSTIRRWTRKQCSFTNMYQPRIPQSCSSSSTYIFMFSCCLKSLDRDLLRLYANLQCINLPYNLLTKLPSRLFQYNKDVKEIYITNNNIEIIESSAFTGLTKLEVLDLSNNNLRSDFSFQETKLLEVLRLDGNFFNTHSIALIFQSPESDFLHLKELSLSNNSIDFWPSNISLNNLTLLNLSQNKLKSWKSCRYLHNLIKLDLSDNSISEVAEDGFQLCRGLSDIDLSNNRIESFGKNTFNNLCYIIRLNLSGNLIARVYPNWFAAVIDNIQNPNEIEHNIKIESVMLECDCKLFAMQAMLEKKLLKFQENHNIIEHWSTELSCKQNNLRKKLAEADFKNCPKNNALPLGGVCRNGVTAKSSFPKTTSFIFSGFVFIFIILSSYAIGSCCFKKRKNLSAGQSRQSQFLHEADDVDAEDEVRVIGSETQYMNVR